MSHPIDIYRPEFEERIFAVKPKSVLDVGFGDGAFLRRAYERGIQATGVDHSDERIQAAREGGLSVQCAVADALPFADRSFDCVAAQLVVHHFPDLRKGLLEMLRVARLGVFILDPWFDETIPSQASAVALERWMKAIDRAQGGVNNGPLTAEDFQRELPEVTIDVAHRLTLVPDAVDERAEKCTAYLDKIDKPETFRKELDRLIADARRTGLTSEGAIFVTLAR